MFSDITRDKSEHFIVFLTQQTAGIQIQTQPGVSQ